MDPFDQLRRPRIKIEAVIAFVLGVVAAYFIQISLGMGGGGLFTFLIVVSVGGLWYHIRRVV